MIKFVCDLRQVDGFLWVLWCPPPIKLTTTIYTEYYMSKSVSHAVSIRKPYVTPRGLNIHEYNAYPYLNNNKVWPA
jgi:hypothetical protein